MPFTAAQVLEIRGYIGSEPTASEIAAGSKVPTDADLETRSTALGSSDAKVVARSYVAMWLADYERDPSKWTLTGRYSQDNTATITSLQAKLVGLDKEINPTAAATADLPVLTTATLTIEDPSRRVISELDIVP